ncbi:methyltransferase family protein [Alicyclobacillus acidiphilus]|uniref:methyltransferase family protein n=1 Tax=Alicyclobacillus acidiphilus TaxID=182455 RepID=UPI0008372D6C|nr:isoprenylcysteine carboxylmethyltransferase family protein [Alicyclobacillus acidiphilus]
MFAIAFLPVILYLCLELVRRRPIQEVKMNHGSSFLIGVVFAWMIVVPTLIWLFVSHLGYWPIGRLWQGTLYLGTLMSLVGVWIRYSAISMLGRYYSRSVGIQAEHKLIQSGWYRWIRHPGYLGTLVTFVGFGLATGSWLSVLFNTSVFFIAYTYRIKTEEMALISHFGESYRHYQERTWRIIPFVF